MLRSQDRWRVRRHTLLIACVALLALSCATPEVPRSPTPTTPGFITSEPPTVTPSLVEVPDVRGQKLAAAKNELRAFGFRIKVTFKFSNDKAGTVLSQKPAAFSEAEEDRRITLTVAKKKPEPPPPPPECHPSYTGACLNSSASDYDCAGGSGDGPLYTGTVRVVGPDEYGLDADGDGLGCE